MLVLSTVPLCQTLDLLSHSMSVQSGPSYSSPSIHLSHSEQNPRKSPYVISGQTSCLAYLPVTKYSDQIQTYILVVPKLPLYGLLPRAGRQTAIESSISPEISQTLCSWLVTFSPSPERNVLLVQLVHSRLNHNQL